MEHMGRQREGEAMSEEKLRHINIEDMQMQHRALGGYAFDRYQIPSGPGVSARVYRLEPGMANYPYHWHEKHQEYFCMLSGTGVLETEEGERPLRPGDVVYCPPCAAGAHRIVNTGTEALVYFEVDVTPLPDAVHYPRSEAWGVIFEEQKRNMFFDRDGNRIEYKDLD